MRGTNANKNLHAFYVSTAWRKLRKEVLEGDRYECQQCKARGYYRRATHVHHVLHYEKYPQYGLAKAVNGKRNLISLCFECHAEIHEYGQGKKTEPLTTERW